MVLDDGASVLPPLQRLLLLDRDVDGHERGETRHHETEEEEEVRQIGKDTEHDEFLIGESRSAQSAGLRKIVGRRKFFRASIAGFSTFVHETHAIGNENRTVKKASSSGDNLTKFKMKIAVG